jgi:hypothetical protein
VSKSAVVQWEHSLLQRRRAAIQIPFPAEAYVSSYSKLADGPYD